MVAQSAEQVGFADRIKVGIQVLCVVYLDDQQTGGCALETFHEVQ